MSLLRLPDTFAATRVALHRIAEEVVATARKPQNEIALMQTPGGFGTPEFDFEGRRMQVRVDEADIVVVEDGAERREAIRSIAAAAAFVGAALYPDGLPDDAVALEIDPEAAAALAAFYAFGSDALEAFRADSSPADETTAVILWPEHFDIALVSGAEQLGRRANYGASPGDEGHSEPYIYVGPWEQQDGGELWNAAGFNGAELPYHDLVAADDPAALVAEFFDVRHEALLG